MREARRIESSISNAEEHTAKHALPVGTLVRIPFASGASIDADRERERVTLRGVDGEVQLVIRMTSDGPVLSFSAAQLEIDTTQKLRVDVDQLELRARNGISVESLGPVSQRIHGESITHCDGHVQLECGSVSMTAHDGDLALDSSCDVTVNGDRVLINCY